MGLIRRFYGALYKSTSSFLVLSKETTLTSLADLQLGSQLAADYQVLLKSTSVMEDVIDELNLKMSPEQLRGSIATANPTGTRILEVTVTNTDGALAKKIADKVVRWHLFILEIRWRLFRLRLLKKVRFLLFRVLQVCIRM